MTENKYTEFYDVGEGIYEVWNIIYNQKVGEIKKERMGKWMHWQLFGNSEIKWFKDGKEIGEPKEIQDLRQKGIICDALGVGFSNGCLKEISKFITPLYSKDKKEAKENKKIKKEVIHEDPQKVEEYADDLIKKEKEEKKT